jgi:hypothetical protein
MFSLISLKALASDSQTQNSQQQQQQRHSCKQPTNQKTESPINPSKNQSHQNLHPSSVSLLYPVVNKEMDQ